MDTTDDKTAKGEAKDDVMVIGGARITIEPSDDPFTSLGQVSNLGSEQIVNYSSSKPQIEENRRKERRRRKEGRRGKEQRG